MCECLLEPVDLFSYKVDQTAARDGLRKKHVDISRPHQPLLLSDAAVWRPRTVVCIDYCVTQPCGYAQRELLVLVLQRFVNPGTNCELLISPQSNTDALSYTSNHRSPIYVEKALLAPAIPTPEERDVRLARIEGGSLLP